MVTGVFAFLFWGGNPHLLKTHQIPYKRKPGNTRANLNGTLHGCQSLVFFFFPAVLGGSFEDLGEPFPSFSTFRKKLWRNIELWVLTTPPQKKKLWKCREVLFFFSFDLLRCSTESKNMRVEPCGYDGCDTSRITQLYQKFFGLIMMILKSKTQ